LWSACFARKLPWTRHASAIGLVVMVAGLRQLFPLSGSAHCPETHLSADAAEMIADAPGITLEITPE
jgi:hypothetical protein